MPDPLPFRRPINWKNLRSDEAERIIRERSQNSANVIVGGHAFDRVALRDILRPDVDRILRTGVVNLAPVRNDNDEWEAIMVLRLRGTRDAGVVTVILKEKDQLFVKTVMWMDVP